jgi:hypothetical protein
MNYFRMQMFIWNNIFFSLGFDVRDHYKEFGGDAAAYTAPVSHCFSSTFRRKKVELLSSLRRQRLGRLSFLCESISQKLSKVSI